MGDMSRGTVKGVETAVRGPRATNNDFVVAVMDPAFMFAKCDQSIPIISDSRDGDEVGGALWDIEDIPEEQLVPRSDAQINVANANSIGG